MDYEDPRISGKFDEIRENGRHNGVDIAVPTGTPILAPRSGIVKETEKKFKEGDRSTPNGNYVRIIYEDGTEGVFIHMEEVKVSKDQEISVGQVIGTSNDTGHSRGPHLHYTHYDRVCGDLGGQLYCTIIEGGCT